MPDAAPAFVWVEELADPQGLVTLDDEASHHVARVCRARLGETLSLTDGRGGLAQGRVESLAPRVTARIERLERGSAAGESVLLCGTTEGRRFDWVVEKLAELGVRRIRPVQCARGRWEEAAVRPERWRRLARAGLEQSRGAFLLSIEKPEALVEAFAREPGAAMTLLADPSGTPITGLQPPRGKVVGVVGPAGGLAPQEIASLQERGATLISLSGNRLRTETAAVSWAAWWAASA